jgi:hypothetical protein
MWPIINEKNVNYPSYMAFIWIVERLEIQQD